MNELLYCNNIDRLTKLLLSTTFVLKLTMVSWGSGSLVQLVTRVNTLNKLL